MESKEKKHVYSRYVIRTTYNPLAIIEKMREHNVICERMYVPPLHRRALLKEFNKEASFLKTEAILNSAVSLPIYPSLGDKEIEYVVNTLSKVIDMFSVEDKK